LSVCDAWTFIGTEEWLAQ